MVFFLCESCGTSLKKNQVEKHKNQCRLVSVSCIDCNHVFSAVSYREHVKCVSEEEKYSGKNYVPKENKGEMKQQNWFEQVQGAIVAVNPQNQRLRDLLNQISNFPNIPRKQQKFENFVVNSLHCRDKKLATEAWGIISNAIKVQSEELGKRKHEDEENKESAEILKLKLENSDEHAPGTKKIERRNEKEECDEPNSTEIVKSPKICENSQIGKFKWGSVMKKILKTEPNNQLKLKKLRKRVIAEFLLNGGHPGLKSENEIAAKFEQKLRKNPKFKVLKDRVTYVPI